MTAVFKPEGPLFRATEHAGGPWSPDMLQGSATTALMTREVERLANASGFAVRRLTFDLWRPAGLRAFGLASEMLRDGRNAQRSPGAICRGDAGDDLRATRRAGSGVLSRGDARRQKRLGPQRVYGSFGAQCVSNAALKSVLTL
jgi:hypothetical protein